MSIRLATSQGSRIFRLAICLSPRPQSRGVSFLHAAFNNKKRQPLNLKLKNFKPVPGFEDSVVKRKGGKKVEQQQANVLKNDEIILELWNDSPRERIGVMDISTAMRDHVRPGLTLVPFHETREEAFKDTEGKNASAVAELDLRDKDANDTDAASDPKTGSTETRLPKYVLAKIDTANAPTNMRLNEKGRGGKMFYLTTNTSKTHLIESLEKTWHFLKLGKNIEFHVVAMKKSGKRVTANSFNRAETRVHDGGAPLQFDWQNEGHLAKIGLHPAHMLHLRPDVISKAMPAGSGISIAPRADSTEYVWALSPAKEKVKATSKRFKLSMNAETKRYQELEREERMKMAAEQSQQLKDTSDEGHVPQKELSREVQTEQDPYVPLYDPELYLNSAPKDLENRPEGKQQMRNPEGRLRRTPEGRLPKAEKFSVSKHPSAVVETLQRESAEDLNQHEKSSCDGYAGGDTVAGAVSVPPASDLLDVSPDGLSKRASRKLILYKEMEQKAEKLRLAPRGIGTEKTLKKLAKRAEKLMKMEVIKDYIMNKPQPDTKTLIDESKVVIYSPVPPKKKEIWEEDAPEKYPPMKRLEDFLSGSRVKGKKKSKVPPVASVKSIRETGRNQKIETLRKHKQYPEQRQEFKRQGQAKDSWRPQVVGGELVDGAIPNHSRKPEETERGKSALLPELLRTSSKAQLVYSPLEHPIVEKAHLQPTIPKSKYEPWHPHAEEQKANERTARIVLKNVQKKLDPQNPYLKKEEMIPSPFQRLPPIPIREDKYSSSKSLRNELPSRISSRPLRRNIEET